MKASALFASPALRRSAALVLAAGVCAFGSGAARAADVYWSIGINTPHVGTVVSNLPPAQAVYVPAPVIVQAAPVYLPAPVYYQPAPIRVRPAPVYVSPRGHGHWKQAHRHRGQHRHRGHRD